MPTYQQYRFDARGWLEAVEETYSDHEIDLKNYLPPFGRTFAEPPKYDPATQIPVWNGIEWIVHELSEFEPTLEEVKTAKLAELAQARWEQETGGLTLPDGTVIKTDRESQGLLTGASLYVLQNASATVEWKGENGWVTLSASDLQQIAMLVRNHVQACFSKERELGEKVEACETAEDVQGISW